MSTNLQSGPSDTSSSSPAAIDSTGSADNAAVDTAAPSAERSDSVAASGKDVVAQLDSDYKRNVLGAEPKEAVAEPTPTETEQPEVEAAEPVEAASPEAPEDTEETEGPRTLDALKKQFPRVSVAPLEEIAKVEAQHFALQQKVDSIGGEVGLEIATPLMPALLSPATPESVETIFQTIATTNPGALTAMSWDILTRSLSETQADPETGRPIRDVTADALVKQFIDPELGIDDIFLLTSAKAAGLIDMEELKTELESSTGKSQREIDLEARLKAIEDKGKQDTAAKENDYKARIQQHVDKTEKFVSDGAMKQVVAIAEEYNWTASKEELNSSDPAVKALAESKIVLGELLTPWLNDFVRSHPKWAGVASLGKSEQAFNVDGNPTVLLKQNGQEVINAAVAAFKSKVRVLNKNLAKSFTGSRNAQLKAKTTRSGAVEPSSIPQVKSPETPVNRPTDRIAQLDEEYAKVRREQRASL